MTYKDNFTPVYNTSYDYYEFLSSPSLWIYGDGFFPVIDRHH